MASHWSQILRESLLAKSLWPRPLQVSPGAHPPYRSSPGPSMAPCPDCLFLPVLIKVTSSLPQGLLGQNHIRALLPMTQISSSHGTAQGTF